MKKILLRRTKKVQIKNQKEIKIPEKTVYLKSIELSADEKEIYNALELRAQIQFNKYVRQGTVVANYSHILVMLLRLRQCCNHPYLLYANRDYLSYRMQRETISSQSDSQSSVKVESVDNVKSEPAISRGSNNSPSPKKQEVIVVDDDKPNIPSPQASKENVPVIEIVDEDDEPEIILEVKNEPKVSSSIPVEEIPGDSQDEDYLLNMNIITAPPKIRNLKKEKYPKYSTSFKQSVQDIMNNIEALYMYRDQCPICKFIQKMLIF